MSAVADGPAKRRRRPVGLADLAVRERCVELSLVREDRDERTSGGAVVVPTAVLHSYVRTG